MKKLFTILIIFTFSLTCLLAQDSQKKFKGWKKTETEHFKFVYEDAQREVVESYVSIADQAWNNIGKVYGFPADKTNVYVVGRTNIQNALTFFSPTEIIMFSNPFTMPLFGFREGWQKLVFTHELVHAANIQFEDKSKIDQYLFGPFSKSIDISSVNGWAIEGLATVLETELTKGGRGRSPYFELNYKAVTLDNGFISYKDIGFEAQPPYSQSYVMGYLIMRSIADRFGLEALSDIERNRKYGQSWEDAVLFVTGVSAQDIYRDVRIALAKKFANERKIPEGIIISPRDLNTNYCIPAIINDDGSIIALRSKSGYDTAVVSLDPSAKTGFNYIQDSNPEEDIESLYKETILFSASFMDEESVTADKDGNIYATIGISKNEKNPGREIESALYKWNKEEGLKKLTKKISLFQPSVSRNGNLLVATQQQGLHMKLVTVDTKTYEKKDLLQSNEFDFIEPKVNADGTKVAFMLVDNERARIAVLDVNNPAEYKILANNEEKIYDPAYPNWNQDGKLTFTCNYRGRLEIFQVEDDNSITPVLSDPIGATWAYKTDRGIYYTSESSSGSVIKMKPASEWGNVADFEGPSPAGEIAKFGHLENDYPDFKPYTVLSDRDICGEKENSEDNQNESKKLVKGKDIKHRSQENIDRAAQDNPVITQIQNEKSYFPWPQPFLYAPFVNLLENPNTNDLYFAPGAFFIATRPKLQMNTGVLTLDFFYFPDFNNFNAEIAALTPLGKSLLLFSLNHEIKFSDDETLPLFLDTTSFLIGLNFPIIERSQHRNQVSLNLITSAYYSLNRTSADVVSIKDSEIFSHGLSPQAGFEFYLQCEQAKQNYFGFDLVGLALSYFDITENKIYFGFEGESTFYETYSSSSFELSVKGRYTPYPQNIVPTASRVRYGGEKLDCSYPARIVPRIAYTFPTYGSSGMNLKSYVEALVSIGNDNDDPASSPFYINQSFTPGAEFSIQSGYAECALGTSYKIRPQEDFDFKNFNFYLTAKFGAFRY